MALAGFLLLFAHPVFFVGQVGVLNAAAPRGLGREEVHFIRALRTTHFTVRTAAAAGALDDGVLAVGGGDVAVEIGQSLVQLLLECRAEAVCGRRRLGVALIVVRILAVIVAMVIVIAIAITMRL